MDGFSQAWVPQAVPHRRLGDQTAPPPTLATLEVQRETGPDLLRIRRTLSF